MLAERGVRQLVLPRRIQELLRLLAAWIWAFSLMGLQLDMPRSELDLIFPGCQQIPIQASRLVYAPV